MAAELSILITGKNAASKAFDDASKSAGGFGKVLADVSKIAGGFLAANVIQGGAQKIMGFLGDSVDAASKLEQSIGGVNAVFKDSAPQILAWGKTAATQAGLSQRAFNDMATPLGAMLKNAGFSMDQVSDKTITLTKRAADMAATFGGPTEDALQAISSALRGELDPIERYGVSLNAAKVEAEAMAMTGKTVAASLTDQEKAAARVNLIFEQTAAAEGQFAREAGSVSGAAEIQKAKMEELQAVIGTKLLPVQLAITQAKLALVEAVVTKVIPALEALYAKHWPAIQAAIETKVIPAVEKLLPVFQFMAEHTIERVKGVIGVIESTSEIVGRVVNGVKAVIDGDWRKAWDEFKGIPSAVLDLLKETIRANLGLLPQLMKEGATKGFNGFKDGAHAVVTEMGEWVSNIPGWLVAQLKQLPELLYKAGKEAGDRLTAGVQDGIKSIPSVIAGALVPGGGGGIKKAVQQIQGSSRDSGGPVRAGVPYMIGRGAQPELFVPNQSGHMYPRGTYGGGGGDRQPIILQIDGREIGRVIVNLKGAGGLRGVA